MYNIKFILSKLFNELICLFFKNFYQSVPNHDYCILWTQIDWTLLNFYFYYLNIKKTCIEMGFCGRGLFCLKFYLVVLID